ncbi:Transcriptional regulator, AraC family [Halanaerobium saccharolyticum subsp. saccharolyticum DSM 6643]|uniref:Transcriptional regulator, AraC family n=1 Tax=Halanaerobium saccharolyticum subsp. saccharolyticum DSM 6643 TaxID=1293054 RepID=M5E0D9_9FIRM|nr:AraC family transcriptional regulator [Halanaerobium saccharolyticum]CCU78927.1 Transcriptional regulator, AraC family [Halanaerobium saccharolyticum subsp. saccharolyticum DSM 6643]
MDKKDDNIYNESKLTNDFSISHRKTSSTVKYFKHYHNAYEILLQNSGSGEFFIKDNNYNMTSKSIFLIDKFDIHKTLVKKNSANYDRFVLQMKGPFLKNNCIFEKYDFHLTDIFKKNIKYIKLKDQDYKKIKYLTEKIIMESTKKKYMFQPIVHAYLLEMVVIIDRIIEIETKYSNKNDKKTNPNLQLAEIIAYINQNYKNKITLQNIAEKLYISKYYLSHFFKDSTGFTVIEFVNNKRIMEAQKLLIKSSENITDIAVNVGFNSLTHFERTFKKINGITPTQYRGIEK